jgi:hypothetical protein
MILLANLRLILRISAWAIGVDGDVEKMSVAVGNRPFDSRLRM